MARTNSKQLTLHLKQLSAEAHSVSDDGDVITRAEAMSLLLWDYALGWEEKDPDDPAKMVRHRPAQWAIQLIYDRLEGKAPNAVDDKSGTMTAADKVSELAKNRINAMTLSVVGDDGIGGPPPYKGKKHDS